MIKGNTEGRHTEKDDNMTTTQTLKHLTPTQCAYIAGFLDGDGSINAQIVRQPEYILKFQIRVTLTFFQKTSRYWVLLQLHKLLKYGTLRKRSDGMAEYAIVGKQAVKHCIELLQPYLRVKKQHTVCILQIIKQLQKNMEPEAFVKLCTLVDKFKVLNDSKKRTLTSETVQNHFLSLNLLSVPVETI